MSYNRFEINLFYGFLAFFGERQKNFSIDFLVKLAQKRFAILSKLPILTCGGGGVTI